MATLIRSTDAQDALVDAHLTALGRTGSKTSVPRLVETVLLPRYKIYESTVRSLRGRSGSGAVHSLVTRHNLCRGTGLDPVAYFQAGGPVSRRYARAIQERRACYFAA